jgi:hypothetical protein
MISDVPGFHQDDIFRNIGGMITMRPYYTLLKKGSYRSPGTAVIAQIRSYLLGTNAGLGNPAVLRQFRR